MIKLVVSDLDGTLLDRNAALSPQTIEAVTALQSRGVLFTIATGRVECTAQPFVAQLGIKIPYIACNGATLVENGKALERHQISASALRELLERAQEMGMSILYTLNGIEYTFEKTPWVLYDEEKYGHNYPLRPFSKADWSDLLVDKFTIMDDVRDGRIELIERMCKELSDRYCFTRYSDKAIEVVDKNATKASALQSLTKLLGIPLAQVMAVGDHQNDVEMLRSAGIGIAVANATDAAKAAADYICAFSNAQGVTEAIERFCSPEGG